MSKYCLVSDFETDVLHNISNDLEIEIKDTKSYIKSTSKYIYPYDILISELWIPFAYGTKYGIKATSKKLLKKSLSIFNGKLRDYQINIKKEAVTYLNSSGSCIISAMAGCGKTCMAIYIATKIKLKTLIVLNRVVLKKQWKEAIQQFTDSKVQNITSKTTDLKSDCDFYLVNALIVPKLGRELFKYIGFVIVDELHLILAEKMSNAMKYLVPKYLIGLSATPYRNDGLNKLIELYFGNNMVKYEVKRNFTYYKINTGISFKCKLNKLGKLDWNNILQQQAEHKGRCQLIIRIIQNMPTITWLIVVKRIIQGEYILDRLKQAGIPCESLLGKKQEYKKNLPGQKKSFRCLVGTTGKIGTGFNDVSLNGLLLCCDVLAYFEQTLFRVIRKTDANPVIIDLVDDNYMLNKHYKERLKIYKKFGGKSKIFIKKFPNFKNWLNN